MTVSAFGPVAFTDQASVLASDLFIGRGASVHIRAGMLVLDGSAVATARLAETSSGLLSLHSDRGIVFKNGASAATATFGPGAAGGVDVKAGERLEVLGGSQIVSGRIPTDVFGTPPSQVGPPGDIRVRAGEILVDGLGGGPGTGIRSEARDVGSGVSRGAGRIEVTADNALTVRGGGAISASTFGTGPAGAVVAEAPRIVVDGTGTRLVAVGDSGLFTGLTGIFSQAEPQSSAGATAGSVTVRASGQLTVMENAKISSATFSEANGGAVTVERTGEVLVSSLGEIRSSSFGNGNAGSVTVRAAAVTIDDAGRGTGGNTGRTGVNSRTEAGSGGDAGAVEVVAYRFTV